MKKASLDVVGTDLSVEQEVPSYDDIIRMQRQDRDRYLDTFKEILSMQKKTLQYEDRLGEFISFMKKYHSGAYWLNHY